MFQALQNKSYKDRRVETDKGGEGWGRVGRVWGVKIFGGSQTGRENVEEVTVRQIWLCEWAPSWCSDSGGKTAFRIRINTKLVRLIISSFFGLFISSSVCLRFTLFFSFSLLITPVQYHCEPLLPQWTIAESKALQIRWIGFAAQADNSCKALVIRKIKTISNKYTQDLLRRDEVGGLLSSRWGCCSIQRWLTGIYWVTGSANTVINCTNGHRGPENKTGVLMRRFGQMEMVCCHVYLGIYKSSAFIYIFR